jgi:hypothetical protein
MNDYITSEEYAADKRAKHALVTATLAEKFASSSSSSSSSTVRLANYKGVEEGFVVTSGSRSIGRYPSHYLILNRASITSKMVTGN